MYCPHQGKENYCLLHLGEAEAIGSLSYGNTALSEVIAYAMGQQTRVVRQS